VDTAAGVSAMSARQRAAAAAGPATAASSPGKDPPGAGGGGLSLGSTASNDTGYSSIGNGAAERAGPLQSAAGTCRPPAAAGDDDEQRPSVAELRQRFQTHSISQPAELSKRCAPAFSPPLSAGSTTTTTPTTPRPFFPDHPGEPVPEENFWT